MINTKIYFNMLLFKILKKGYDFIKKYKISIISKTMITLIITTLLSLTTLSSTNAESNKTMNRFFKSELSTYTIQINRNSSNTNPNVLDTTILKKANKLVDINEKFYVLDYLSGNLIQLERLGGIDYFESKPLNLKQLETLRVIYEKINLTKRPIILINNKGYIAATMKFNITNNIVEIHFLDSSTQNKINIMRQIDTDLKQKILK